MGLELDKGRNGVQCLCTISCYVTFVAPRPPTVCCKVGTKVTSSGYSGTRSMRSGRRVKRGDILYFYYRRYILSTP